MKIMFGVVIPMRKATDRRRAILDLLIKSDKPISKTYLIEVFGVTKNVIDNDISAIRDKGYNVVGFPGCTIRINGTPVPHERYKRLAPTVRYPFLRLFIGSKFLMFFPFISKRYDSLRTRARLASA